MKARVLVVDDEDTIRKLLKSRLERDGYDVVLAPNADEAEKELRKGASISVVITDLKMPGRDGVELTRMAKELDSSIRVIMITGHGEKDVAIRALREGASDYLEKPFDLDELSHSVKRCIHEFRLEQENQELVARLEARVERIEGKTEDKFWYVSKGKAMGKVNEWLTVLRREAMRGGGEEPSVLIVGESGTGKEGIARMIHAGSRRGKGPWIAVNCANFSEQLLESELFGHEKGAFTGANSLKRGLFEIAKDGTLFLDEIGEMDVKLQAKILRVLQEKVFRRVGSTVDQEADVRIVAATNQDMEERVKKKEFREDLYHRLNRVVVELPALRERGEDILPMAKEFFERSFSDRGKTFEGLSSDAEEAIFSYHWPGNVRELLNVVERTALIWTGTGTVTGGHLSLPKGGSENYVGRNQIESVASPYHAPSDSGLTSFMELKKKWNNSFEREYLISALDRHDGNVSAAAREAKLDRSNFLRLLRRHGLRANEYRKVA